MEAVDEEEKEGVWGVMSRGLRWNAKDVALGPSQQDYDTQVGMKGLEPSTSRIHSEAVEVKTPGATLKAVYGP